jgi:hypothetical protein
MGILHPQRPGNSFFNKFSQTLAGNNFHHVAENISVIAINKPLARLSIERQFDQSFDHFTDGHIFIGQIPAVNSSLKIFVAGRAIAIRNTGGVGQEIANSNRPPGGNPAVAFNLPALSLYRHISFLKLGNIAAHRIIKEKPAFLHQHHDGHRSHRFRLRGNTENSVNRHRLRFIQPKLPHPALIGNPSVAGYQEHHSGRTLPVAVVLHHPRQAFESFCR